MSLSGCAFFYLDHGGALALVAFGVLFGLLLILDERSKHTNLVVLMFLEVKAVLLAKAHLEQIVIKTLLGDANFACCVFQRVAHEVSVTNNTVVELAPETDLLNDLLNRSLFSALLASL